MSIIKAINKAFDIKEQRGWDRLYFAVDLHGTVFHSTHSNDGITVDFYPLAKEVLQMLAKRNDIILIMYTCSKPSDIEKYDVLFRENNIIFDYFNRNPEVETKDGNYGHFDSKFYFNVLLEDKAGFDPMSDWEEVMNNVHLTSE